jgi:MYXO-CTERM domain-containing protein
MHARTLATAALAVLAGVVGSAQAQIVDITQPGTTLASVLGRQFIVGDKLFTMPANAFGSSEFNASNIMISALTTPNPNVGVGFRLTGGFNDAPGNGASDFILSYSVEILPQFVAQGLRFTGAHLRFNGSATGAGSYARVDETVMNANNIVLGNHSVWAIGGGTSDHEDIFTSVQGLTRLNLVKDVQFFANGTTGTAGASFVDQVFNQTVLIPLPTTAGLALLGLGGIAVRRRRNR